MDICTVIPYIASTLNNLTDLQVIHLHMAEQPNIIAIILDQTSNSIQLQQLTSRLAEGDMVAFKDTLPNDWAKSLGVRITKYVQ